MLKLVWGARGTVCLAVACSWPRQGGTAELEAWRDACVGTLWGVGAQEVPGFMWGRAGGVSWEG